MEQILNTPTTPDIVRERMAALERIADRDCAFLNLSERRERIYREEFIATMLGDGDFWMTGPDWRTDAPKYDAEQYLEVFRAVQIALQNPGSDADRWAVLMARLRPMAHDYADHMAGEV